jgi:hypothetical protein
VVTSRTNAWAISADDFVVRLDKGTRAMEALVLDAYYGKVPLHQEKLSQKSDQKSHQISNGAIVPTLRIGFRFQKGISVPPTVTTATLPNERGSTSDQSASGNRIEGHWPLTGLPFRDKILFKDKNGVVVEEVGFLIDLKRKNQRSEKSMMIDISAHCVAKGAGLEQALNHSADKNLNQPNSGNHHIDALFLGCDDIQNDVTLLVVGHDGSSLSWSPVKEGDWRMGSQLIGLAPRGASEAVHLSRTDGSVDSIEVALLYTGMARATSILLRPWGLEGYVMGGVALSAREQHAAPRGFRAFDFSRTIPIEFGLRGRANLIRKKLDAEVLLESTMANFLLVGNGDGRLAFVPGLAWHLIEARPGRGERWLPSVLFGIRQEIHDLFLTDSKRATLFPVMGRGAIQSKLLLRPELGIRLGHSMGRGSSWISYQATLTPGRYDEFAPSLTLNQEIRFMNLGRSLNGWGIRIAHNRYRMKTAAWMLESDRITAGLLFSL